MPHLLQIHLGPVQEFIAAARRSRDLWFGSWLLSELSKAAARSIAEREPDGAQALIFPAVDNLAALEAGSDLAVANKIVAVISENPQDVAKNARDAVTLRLHALRDDAIPSALRKGLVTWKNAEAQIDDLPEFYWIAVPFDGTDFPDVRRRADALLAARKNTRSFSPVGDWANSLPKSSLDGRRESVIPKGAAGLGEDIVYKVFRARVHEQLSGVDLLKRLGNRPGETHTPFPSTSHMAAMPLYTKLQQLDADAQARDAWADYQDALTGLDPRLLRQERIHHTQELPLLKDSEGHALDGSLLFESRLRDSLVETALRDAQTALKTFYTTTGLDQPLSYYALLVGDGDFMGKAIGCREDPAANRQFSRTLATFATEVDAIVTEERGALVYAGGDDVMAFLPLHTAVPCAARIASRFREIMQPFPYDGAGNSPTFSAGLAIVHHLEPLEDALELARDAEKRAKRLSGKNALGIALAKRSGEPRQVVGHWQIAGEPAEEAIGLDARILDYAALYQQDRIPGRLAYQLRTTWLTLGGSSETPGMSQILQLEAQRLINRKRTADGGDALDDEAIQVLLRELDGSGPAVAALATELMIAAEIAKASDLAGVALQLTPAGLQEEQAAHE